MRDFLIAVLSLILLLAVSSPALAAGGQPVIGSIRTVNGEAFVLRGKLKLPANIKLRIQTNDVLVTGSDGSMGVILRDDTTISIGPDSRLVIDKFLFEPSDKRFGLWTTLIKGTAAYISGQIGKLSPGSVRMKTPVATIGIRGTKFLVRIEQP